MSLCPRAWGGVGGGYLWPHVLSGDNWVGISITKSLLGDGHVQGWVLTPETRVPQDTVDKRAVPILLECLLVSHCLFITTHYRKDRKNALPLQSSKMIELVNVILTQRRIDVVQRSYDVKTSDFCH